MTITVDNVSEILERPFTPFSEVSRILLADNKKARNCGLDIFVEFDYFKKTA